MEQADKQGKAFLAWAGQPEKNLTERDSRQGKAWLEREKLLLLLLRAGLALGSLAVAGLYFQNKILLLVAAALIHRMTLSLFLSQRQSRRRRQLSKEAVLWLEELTVGLKAGKALATATRDLASGIIRGARRGGGNQKAAESWRHCQGLLELHYPVELAYKELASRLELPELKTLAAVLSSAVKTGVSLTQVLLQCTASLRERLESREILEARLASRRLEGSLLAAAPALYTACLRMAVPAYMEPLYHGRGWIIAAVVFGLQMAGSAGFFRLLLKETPAAELILADFQEEMALQLSAGLSLPEAWQQAAQCRAEAGAGMAERFDEKKAGEEERKAMALEQRLIVVAKQLAMGVPFAAALETARSQGEEALRRLAELLLQNYHLGGGSLAVMLSLGAKESRHSRLLSQNARDSRRETWLLFPMILLLISSLVLTAAPALLSF